MTNQEGTRDVSVAKKWVNSDGTELPWPDGAEATIQLVADNSDVSGKTTTLNADKKTDTFTGLPITNDAGDPIVYTVRETNVTTGYSFVDVTGSAETSLVVTNKEDSRTVSIEKKWVNQNGQAIEWPNGVTATVLLKADNDAVMTKDANGDPIEYTAELTASQKTFTFTDLPKTNASGNPIVYTVEEIDMTTGYQIVDITGSAETTLTITNRAKDIPVAKKWVNSDGTELPWPSGATAKIQLVADSDDVAGRVITLTESQKTYTFSGLPIKNANSDDIVYTVREEEVTTGYSFVNVTGSVDTSLVVTNKEDSRTVSIEKKWVNQNGQAIEWPNGVTATVLLKADNDAVMTKDANGDPIEYTAELTASQKTFTFTDLPKTNASGNPIVYTVEEIDMTTGYQIVDITGSAETTLVITNRAKDIPVEKKWVNTDGTDLPWPDDATATIQLVADSNDVADRVVTLTKAQQKYTFSGLPIKNVNGDDIVYTIRETNLTTGYSFVDVTGSVDTSLVVTNSRDKGALKIKKIVKVNGLDTGINYDLVKGEYTFTVVGQTDKYTTGKSFTATVTINDQGEVSAVSLSDVTDINSISSKDEGGYAVIEGLPTGDYLITEVLASAQKEKGIHLLDQDPADGIVKVIKDGTGDVPVAEITNNINVGDLKISKTVNTTGEVDKEKEFTFTVQLSVPATGNVKLAATYPAVKKIWSEDRTALINDPHTTSVTIGDDGFITPNVVLRAGEFLLIKDLPAEATYKATEIKVGDKEISDGQTVDGYSNSKLVFEGTVSTSGADKTFINTYESNGSIDLYARKILLRRTLAEGMFSFELYRIDKSVDAGGNTIETPVYITTVVNDGAGKIAFEGLNDLKYTQETFGDTPITEVNGQRVKTMTIDYRIIEHIPDGSTDDPKDAAVTYETRPVDITVTLTDDLAGTITATASPDATNPNTDTITITFTNIVTPIMKVDADKKDVLLPGAEFKVWDEAGELMDEFTTRASEAHPLENLEINKIYRLEETVKPNGYLLWKQSCYFMINDQGKVIFNDEKTVDENGLLVSAETSAYIEVNGDGVIVAKDTMKKLSAAIHKVWDDDDNRDGIRGNITVQLLQNGKETKLIKEVELNPDNNWMAMVPNLDAVYVDGEELKEYTYEWTEAAVEGYTPDYSGLVVVSLSNIGTSGTLSTLTNKHTPDTVEISVKKEWEDNDNAANKREPSINVVLYADGKAIETATLDASNNWSANWTELKNCREDDTTREIVYTVAEETVPAGYDCDIRMETGADGELKFTVTNTYDTGKLLLEKEFAIEPWEPFGPDDSPKDIPVYKTWNDNNNKYGNRPEFIKVRLLADGEEKTSDILTEENNWRTVFTGLPRFTETVNEEGKAERHEIAYTITEDPVDWYETEINGFNIRNTYVPEPTSVTVKKVWADNNDEQKKRPTSIAMKLSNGMIVILNAKNKWTATIDDLPTVVNGQPVTYTWTEQTVLGYDLTSVVTEGNTTTFTNTVWKRPETPPGTGKKPKTPGTLEELPDYETPLGVEVIINHVGDCFD